MSTDSSPPTNDDKPETVDQQVMSEADELPAYLEMTPEIAEEEAIRGDVMLRWAAIFLTILLAFSAIADSRTLVHIRSGDAMREGSFLPPGTDPFAYTLEGQSTPNVSWLFDRVVSHVYGIGENALTWFKVALAGIVALILSRVAVKGLPTWWSSICCVLAAAAISVDFMPITDIVTLLGVALTCLMLHRFQAEQLSGATWKFPVLIAIWCNLDPRAYLGVAAVALFALGLKLRRSAAETSGSKNGANADASVLFKAAAFSVLALLLNPSPVASLMGVWTTYAVEYPTMAKMMPLSPIGALDGSIEYASIWQKDVFANFEFAYVCGLSLLLVAIAVLLISWEKEDLPFALVFVFFTALALVALKEMPAACVVACATAGTAGQRWYRRTFKQEYTIDKLELLYSRGGRAITVLGMAVIAFFIVTDRLPTRTTLGNGFEADLKATIESTGETLALLPDDARVLPTRMEQGDVLIWHGKPTYIDSRARLFGNYADSDSIAHRFNSMRQSVSLTPYLAEQKSEEGTGDEPEIKSELLNDDWLAEYNDLKISHLMIRLTPPNIPYQLTNSFLRDPYWGLSHRGPSSALFTYSDPPASPAYDIRKKAFTEPKLVDVRQDVFSRPKDFYQKHLYETRPSMTAPLRDAMHYFNMESQYPPAFTFNVAREYGVDPTSDAAKNSLEMLGKVLAGPMMTIRRCNEAIKLDPQNTEALRLRGLATMKLSQGETEICRAFGGTGPNRLRFLQAVASFRQVTIRNPDDLSAWKNLAALYQMNSRRDLTLECLDRMVELEPKDDLSKEQEELLRNMYETRDQLAKLIEDRKAQLELELKDSVTTDPRKLVAARAGIIQRLYQEGYVRMALDLYEENKELLNNEPGIRVAYSGLLLEAGLIEEGHDEAVMLSGLATAKETQQNYMKTDWQTTVAVGNMMAANHEAAVMAWSDKLSKILGIENITPELVADATRTMPLVPQAELMLDNPLDAWVLPQVERLQSTMGSIPFYRSEADFLRAVTCLEAGNGEQAAAFFRSFIENGSPSHPLRPLGDVYLSQLGEDHAKFVRNHKVLPWEKLEFPEIASTEPAADSKPDAATPEESAKPKEDTPAADAKKESDA